MYIHVSAFTLMENKAGKTPVRVLKTLGMGRNRERVLIAHGEAVGRGDKARVMMALTDRQLYRHSTDPRSSFFPVYRSWLPALPLLEALLLTQEMGSASRHRATTHGLC